MSQFPLCTYLHDDGHPCRSAAVRGRQFCLYHLRHRGRLMRMAQSRALNRRFQLFLPPPEDPAAIHSALTQVIEALAADMIEPSRARALISGLRLCLQSLKKKESWHDSAYHCDQPLDYENFEAEYGLPKDVDLSRSPEEVFPPATEAGTDNRQLTTDNSFVGADNRQRATDNSLPEPDIAAEAQHIVEVSRGLPTSHEDSIRFGSYVTPLDAEMMEVTRTQGFDAALKIQDQFERNVRRRVRRRQSSADRERYALVSMQRNLQHVIERHAAKLAADRAAQDKQEFGCAAPPSFDGVGSVTPAPKKLVASETQTLGNANENAKLTPTGSIG